ncbi:MAG: hypothetical protein ACD_3C00220G0004 [uncultured bacterium (gcode 4)]|uniref:Radical SAM protein n=1 Tax=uncultured bacterium (gcode 4) TaxID=1234023 RepID=K2FWI9_9BACT|nr:MAG: hypothetical protein ACD_3C00220G0004 [uncultured bacterium (gcode 4)]
MEKSVSNSEINANQPLSWPETVIAVQKYAIDIHNILCHSEDAEWNEICVLELWSLVTKSIMEALDAKRKKWEDKTLWLAECDYPIILDPDWDDPEVIYGLYRKKLENFCENAASEWMSPILGFSFIWAYWELPRFSKIIKEMKAKYPKLICIIGWTDFRTIPEKTFLDKIFGYWMDIVNIWWASEFIDFFWDISKSDVFYRDENWLLRLKTERNFPQNLVFEYQKDEMIEVRPWEDIKTSSYYSRLNKAMHFSIRNNPCLNNCSYCATYLHKPTPLSEKDLEDSIADCNRYLSLIEETEISLRINNPNPMQYIDKFTKFLMSLDLSKGANVNFFWDFMWMANPKIYEKTVKLIDDMLEKWPNLEIFIRFWIDALHAKDDWEFLWRTIWSNIAKEEKYESWFKALSDFHKRYEGKRVGCIFNLIMHPNMKLEDYKEKFEFATKYKNVPMWAFPLVAHFNTQIERDHRWFYIPEYETADIPLLDFNTWWHLYLNSRYLDCYVFLKNTWSQFFFSAFLDFFNSIEDENKDENIFYYFMVWHYWELRELVKEHNSIKLLFYKGKREKIRKELDKLLDFTFRYLEFMKIRENYIIGINPGYRTEKFDELFGLIEENLLEFKELWHSRGHGIKTFWHFPFFRYNYKK